MNFQVTLCPVRFVPGFNLSVSSYFSTRIRRMPLFSFDISQKSKHKSFHVNRSQARSHNQLLSSLYRSLYLIFLGYFQVSTNILRKYSGPVDIWLSILFSEAHTSGTTHCLINECPRQSFFAMAQHASQWVWYVCFLNFI